MPELRIDPLSGLRVIVAGERADRPGAWLDFEPPAPIDPDSDPFLEGHEDQTPPELYALRAPPSERQAAAPPNGPGWRVRVVPNLYPALVGGDAAAGDDPLGRGRGEVDLFAARPATGAHEVIVNGPRPVATLHELGPEQLETAMGVWAERIATHASAACVHVIVNEGRTAGASLPHTHAQLYALPFVPAQIARERERFTAYWERTQGRNLLEDIVQEEVRRGERLVAVDSEAVVLCPFAARVPYQLQVVPRTPAAVYGESGALGARLLHEALGRLATALGAVPPLNLWVRTAPRGAERFCWRIDVLPRLAQLAGLEVGTGVHLNPMPPERAAGQLRAADGEPG